jgi:alpha-L-fucosidase 2
MKIIKSFCLLTLICHNTVAGNLPSDVLAELNSYNVTWTSPSTNGSPGSMPIGNGDITANVWVENNGGDLVMYIGKSDSWSEATRLLKVGRIRAHFSPNPFAAGSPFSQTLNYYNGELDIVAGASGSQVTLRIYVDANNPVIRIEASGQQDFTMSISNEIWRSSTMAMNSGDSGSFYGVEGAPTTPSESADQTLSLPDRLVWYHQDAGSYFDTLFSAENLSGASGSYTDPWLNRIFGATILATNFTVVNNQQLQSGSGTNFLVSIYPYTAQTSSESTWQSEMNSQISLVTATNDAISLTNHYAWWDNLWNRSWIFVSGDDNAASVTSGYLAQRYVEACMGRGQYPIKFNGGTITYDFNGQNGDFRAWGPSYWNQNTRLLYWPMLACGDTDMILPFFNIYTNLLPLQEAATSNYYNHGGAFFPETFNVFGLYNGDNWGWNDSSAIYCSDTYIKYHYQGGLETLAMMLACYNYTQNTSFASNYIIPVATQAIRFFEDHWPVVNGKLFFYPANACETYWSCTNSADYISGLMSDIQQLQALPANITTPALLTEWSNVYNELPPLPMDPTGAYLKPAENYGSPMNSENPECYPIFPYRLYGIGLPHFNIALATFNNRTIQTYKYDWSQDPIEEALVGLTSAAQTDVVNNFNDTDSSSHYQAYWSARSDYVPTEDTGGAAMIALQYMLMQCVGSQIQLFPAWPNGWNVDFKLNAPGNTSVRAVLQNGGITQLTVTPASRTNDLVEPVPAPPTGLTGYGGYAQVELFWTASAGAGNYNVERATVNGGPYTPIAAGVTNLNYIDTGLVNNTNYYYVVLASNIWGNSGDSAQVTVTPGSADAARSEGDLIVNLQSSDLTAGSPVWTNRTSNTNGVGNFSTILRANLSLTNATWNSQTTKALLVGDIVGKAVQSALRTPADIIGNNPVSAEAWIYATAVNQQNSCVIGYGLQGGSSSPEEDREFNYNDPCCGGGVSGDFGSYDTAWATPPAAGAWHYLAWTYDGATVRLYLDGVLNVQNTFGAQNPLNTPSTVIGIGAGLTSGPNIGADAFQGCIAAARVESGVLTSTDITSNYIAGPLASASAVTPGGLAAVAGDGRVVLTWDSSANAASYNVKSSSSSNGAYTVLATNLTLLSFTDTGLSNGTTYYFVVSAVNSGGESSNSVPVSAQPVSLAPPLFNFAVNGSQIQLIWPQDHTGWSLQAQTNSSGNGISTNWVTIPASTLTNQMAFPIGLTNGSVFFRLVYP